jgi:hypothetical protein
VAIRLMAEREAGGDIGRAESGDGCAGAGPSLVLTVERSV